REKYQRSTKEAAALVSWKKSTMGKTFMVLALSAALVLVSLRISLSSEPPVNQTDGIALKGYDPVAYFTENKALQGSDQFTAQYQGSTYRFESAANRDAFNASPARYVPQYGGYCAYGIANGHKADISPEAFTIVNDKLYLNYDKAVRFLWRMNIPNNVDKADKNWPDAAKPANQD